MGDLAGRPQLKRRALGATGGTGLSTIHDRWARAAQLLPALLALAACGRHVQRWTAASRDSCLAVAEKPLAVADNDSTRAVRLAAGALPPHADTIWTYQVTRFVRETRGFVITLAPVETPTAHCYLGRAGLALAGGGGRVLVLPDGTTIVVALGL